MIEILRIQLAAVLAALVCCSACGDSTAPADSLVLAVTTSTRDSGLLEAVLPSFEDKHGVRIDVLAVGTGAALKQGAAGDVDLIIVHDRAAEKAFMKSGAGARHAPLFSNRFVLIGPRDDPAGIRGLTASSALQTLANRNARYVSRGDDSGTHRKEKLLLRAAGLAGIWKGCVESGNGMGVTLVMTDQMQAYALSDRATFLRFRTRIELEILIEEGDLLDNPYSAIVISESLRGPSRRALAGKLCDYLLSERTQKLIGRFECSGETPFVPVNQSRN